MDKQAQILEIIRKVTGKKTDVAADESLFDNGILDSFALQDVVNELESAFGLKIPDSDLTPRKFESIERIESYLKEHEN